MLTKQMIRDGLQYYRWETDYPLHTTTDSMNDFIYRSMITVMELDDAMEEMERWDTKNGKV